MNPSIALASGGRSTSARVRRRARARRLGDGHGLGLERLDAGEHAGQRGLDREQRWHRAHTPFPAVISVIVPVHDEEQSVALLHDGFASTLDAVGEPWEAVFVDDGSTDVDPPR